MDVFTQNCHNNQVRSILNESIHFHCALGFATLTLTYPLDSLVRVSRRVGWRADRFATDPVPAGPPRPSQRAVGRHGCPVSASRTPQESEAAYTGGGSSVPRRIGTGEAITVSAEAPTYLPRRLLTAPRTGRGALPAESAHGRPASTAGRVGKDPLPSRRAGHPS